MAALSDNALRRQRLRLVVQLERLLDAPATYLAFVFAAALVTELVLTAQRQQIPAVLGWLQTAIWAFFIVHFTLGVIIAPDRIAYVRHNLLTALSLLVPFLRVVRVLRILPVLRAANLVRIFGGVNRTIRSLRQALAWNGFGLAAGFAGTVALFGSAGLYLFESEAAESPIDSYADALWWVAATLTSVGAQQEPVTIGGRIIALFVMVAGLVVLGYVAGLLGSVLFERRPLAGSRGMAPARTVRRDP